MNCLTILQAGTIVRHTYIYSGRGDRVRHIAVEDLVLGQEDKPKSHRSAREISHETAILRSSVHRIIHRDLQLKCFK